MRAATRTARQAIRVCFQRYAVFHGRAGRQEYWWFALFAMAGFWVIAGLCAAFAALSGETDLAWTLFFAGQGIWAGVVGVPHAAVGARRLQDTGHSGWLMLAHIVPSGHWAVVALACAPGEPGANRFGPPRPLTRLP